MEVGQSIEVFQKLALSLAETSLYFETNARREKHFWFTVGRQLPSQTVFFLSDSWNEDNLSVSSAWWPLNRGGNNGRTLVGMDKKGSQSLNRRLISHSFLQLFRDFDNWPLKRGWPLNRGLTVEPKEPPSCLITCLLIALYPANWNLSDSCDWSALNLS